VTELIGQRKCRSALTDFYAGRLRNCAIGGRVFSRCNETRNCSEEQDDKRDFHLHSRVSFVAYRPPGKQAPKRNRLTVLVRKPRQPCSQDSSCVMFLDDHDEPQIGVILGFEIEVAGKLAGRIYSSDAR
jgi:hypothetical protein